MIEFGYLIVADISLKKLLVYALRNYAYFLCFEMRLCFYYSMYCIPFENCFPELLKKIYKMSFIFY